MLHFLTHKSIETWRIFLLINSNFIYFKILFVQNDNKDSKSQNNQLIYYWE